MITKDELKVIMDLADEQVEVIERHNEALAKKMNDPIRAEALPFEQVIEERQCLAIWLALEAIKQGRLEEATRVLKEVWPQ